ncbi:2-keto-4-pentenoate hydratase [Nocardioides sp. LS1]|uniref:2-keto-4-pentenoate hydratase n=1 Tax=Nocardioides sp. LS1 TaxID=1027620 RepID=UPI000F616CF3|nr:fumarylacetoacetate hydrolase family protein [Nocardioides sp. LS1]GCD88047.1 4-oxalocrotonate decarboxylase [Nocardioides sp. LS1]
MNDIHRIVEMLDSAATDASPVDQVTSRMPLTLEQAYAVQHRLVACRVQRGDTVSGVKLGFTSRAKAEQMGVSDVIIGSVTEGMCFANGSSVDPARFIHPRVEPEVAFRLDVDVDPGDPNAVPVVTQVAPALEVIDSRYRNFSFTLEDVVADNTSAAGYVLGPWISLEEVRARRDLANLGVVLEIDGEIAETGSTAAILGDPLRAVAAVKRMARAHGFALPAGIVILAGAATAAAPLPVTPGSYVEATVEGFGRVSVSIGGDHG